MLVTMDGTPQAQTNNDFIVHTAPDSARSENDASNAPARTLAQLGKGEHATVVSINANQAFGALDTLVTRRLWELGFLPGAQISVVGFGLLSRDPIAVKIGGTKFALRRAEAQKILVSAANSESEQTR